MKTAPPALRFLFADWTATHCAILRGFDLGRPFVLVG